MSASDCLQIKPPSTLEARRVELEDLFGGDDDLGRGFDRLMDFVRDFAGRGERWNEVIILKRQLKELQDDERRLGPSVETPRKRNELLDRALKLIEAVAGETTVKDQPAKLVPDLKIVPPPAERAERLPFEKAREEYSKERSIPTPEHPTAYFCRGISRGYRGRRKFQLHDISLDLRPGEITGLVGPNASGKTTLLRIIAGELLPRVGHYVYPLLHPEATQGRQIDWGRVRSQISFVRQHPYRWFGRLVGNLYRQAALTGLYGEDNRMEVDFILERLNLSEYRDAGWNDISGGYRMRFELAKALVSRPKLLILDEPLAPLDPDAQLLFLQDLKDIASSRRQAVAVIISSQHLFETEAVADRILFLKDGGAEFYGDRTKVGGDRRENTFELAIAAPAAELEAVLGELVTHVEPAAQNTFFLRAPTTTSWRDIMMAISKSKIELHYFRDISCSTRSLFGQKDGNGERK